MMTISTLSSKRVLVVLTILLLLVAIIPPITQAAPPRDGPAVYYVQYGDTLFSISRRFGTTVPTLMAANGLVSDYIFAGQRLVISSVPGPTPTPSNYTCQYTVQPHDTIYNIAYRYQIPWQSLMQANYQNSPYQYGWTYLYVGQQLYVPCLSATPTPFPMYTIQSGDNLFRIAIQYGTSIYAIARVNGIPNPNWVWAGQSIVVPYPGTVQWPANIPTAIPYATATPTVSGTPATVTATPTATTPANTGVVIMQNIAFLPNVITISVGQTVLWWNADSLSHTVSSGAPGALDGKFRSSQLAPGQSFSFTFTQAGTYPYFCEIYGARMTGTVTVQ